jgi:hypothetical protein
MFDDSSVTADLSRTSYRCRHQTFALQQSETLAEALIALRRHIRLIKFSMGLLRGVHVKYFLFICCGLTDEGGQCYKPPSLI